MAGAGCGWEQGGEGQTGEEAVRPVDHLAPILPNPHLAIHDVVPDMGSARHLAKISNTSGHLFPLANGTWKLTIYWCQLRREEHRHSICYGSEGQLIRPCQRCGKKAGLT